MMIAPAVQVMIFFNDIFGKAEYEIILTDYEIFCFTKYEIK
jgi:hypothetical protein